MSRATALLRALFSRRWLLVTVVVLVGMVVLARLGIWQLDRLDQRRGANEQLRQALALPPFSLNDEVGTYADVDPDDVPPDLANRNVTGTGSYDYDRQLTLLLQNWQGQAGVHLITPLRLAGSDAAVLVDRGWIPDAEVAAGNAFEAADEPAVVEGYVARTERLRRLGAGEAVTVTSDGGIYRVDIERLADAFPYPLLPFYIVQAPPAGIDSDLPLQVPKEVDLSEGPHLGYAIQWFIFSIGLGVGYVLLVNKSLA